MNDSVFDKIVLNERKRAVHIREKIAHAENKNVILTNKELQRCIGGMAGAFVELYDYLARKGTVPHSSNFGET